MSRTRSIYKHYVEQIQREHPQYFREHRDWFRDYLDV